jgi:recombination protein RecA
MAEEKAKASDFIKDLGPVKYFLSSGSTLLDLAIANRLPGGFPAGRISHIYGNESTGKSLLGGEVLGSAQRQGGRASLNDSEGTWDLQRAHDINAVQIDNPAIWSYDSSETIEDLFDRFIFDEVVACHNLKVPSCSCAVIDTLSAIPSKVEKETKLEAPTMGQSRPKQLSVAFRKYIDAINSVNLALVFLDQTRENVGVTFGDSLTTSGGKALRFYASVRVILSHIDKIKNSAERAVGVKLGFYVKKNKIGPPFREGEFRILFDYGIDDIGSNLEWLHENDPEQIKVPKKDRPWVFRASAADSKPIDLKGRGLNALIEKVEAENLEKCLISEVERVWKVVYMPPDRKPRQRV